MSRLIDTENLDFVSYQGIPDGYKDSFDSGVLYAMNLIDEQPTIDAVPVVRCKDCKHSDTFPVCGEPHSFPLKCLSIRYGGVFEDWFCEHGERR